MPMHEQQLFRRCDIARILGVSLQTVDRLRRQGLFPEPVYIAKRIPAWPVKAVMDAIKAANAGDRQLDLQGIK